MPEKRSAKDRVGDFDEIYGDFDITSAENRPVGALSAVCLLSSKLPSA